MDSYIVTRRAMRRLAALAVTAALTLTPTLATAETCVDLAQSDAQNDREAKALVAANKGSATVFLGCVVVGTSNYDQYKDASRATGAFGICAAIGCAFPDSYSNCASVNATLFVHALRSKYIIDRKHDLSCP